jgi:Flp pilus assembly protein TadD
MFARRFDEVAGPVRRLRMLGGIAACLAVGACSQTTTGLLDLAAEAPPDAAKAAHRDAEGGKGTPNELAKATEYWGKEFAKNPRDPEKALNYARNLKAMGAKRQALAVLQQASIFAGNNRALFSEYGRLALEFDQITLAQRLLEQADDPANPDWHVISARGTVLAKQGSYHDAIPFYERALALAPGQASVLNNLALAYAMEGSPEKAEPLLKRAAATGDHDPRVSQNLALVLGLQGKYDEAKIVAARDLSSDKAAANVDYIRSIVLAEAQPMAPAPKVETVASRGPSLKGSALDDSGPGWTPQVAVAPAKR